jgi:hypothetical protein
VPLYTCDRCGFTSTAFRVKAVDAHASEYPSCPGTVRIVYHLSARRSELERYRDEKTGAMAITGRGPQHDLLAAAEVTTLGDQPMAS